MISPLVIYNLPSYPYECKIHYYSDENVILRVAENIVFLPASVWDCSENVTKRAITFPC